MYITYISLRQNVAHCIIDNDKLVTAHSWISDSLKSTHSRPKRYMWRINNDTNMIILSKAKPNPLVMGRYGDLATMKTMKYHINIHNGQIYKFSLFANPTKRIGTTHKIKQLCDSNDQEQWLLRKAKNNGFQIKQLQLKSSVEKILIHNSQLATKLIGVDFHGQLMVTNRQLFINALVNGIGREKSYGFGLLIVN